MSLAKSSVLAIAALSLASQPVFAQVQRDCVNEAEVSAMVIYAVPHALRGVRSRCGANLASDGFLAAHGAQLARRYNAVADANWPGALSGLNRMVGTGELKQQMPIQLDRLPPEVVRPLFDEMIAQKVAAQVAVADCRRIERAAEAFAPLEPEELGRISAVILSLVGVDKPKICVVN